MRPHVAMLDAGPMRTPHPVPRELRGQLFRGRDALAQGLVTKGYLRGPAFTRVIHGVYVDARIPVDHGLRCRAAQLVLPPESVLTANSAAWWYGVQLARPEDTVTVALPPGVHIAGPRLVRVHRTPILPADISCRNGLRVAAPVRAAWDLATLSELTPAVQYVDALMHSDWLSQSDLDRRLATGAGLWRISKVRTVAQWTDARSESPAETELRLVVLQSNLPAPVLQFEVRRLGILVARVDFAWPAHRLALEYDGAGHTDLRVMRLDRRRLNALVEAGWTVFHATAADLRRPAALIAQLRTALSRPLAA